ncbi:xylosidase [Galbibacter sp. BG1]|uniref:glycoside hydrolase family 71/99-like protein n=1 Tax=Galbibacter sp. BG1 TaxID=1170699 RepID=UPI0015BEC783|nr:glycoside hydrolase family 71/99-like protein [Galbibacter sp. BG1]QLE02460.1 xylosidase [Galbibacter sp. BG1]
MTDAEKYPTPFRFKNGDTAYVFSSANVKTVDRHFKWMKTYGIDGIFVQRFILNIKDPKRYTNLNKVFDNCFKGAVNHERLISVMYDLTGSDNDILSNIKKDWIALVNEYNLNSKSNSTSITFEGKPIVAIWGAGFKNRNYSLVKIEKLIDFFKNDPKYGGCSILLGVPNHWRTLDGDRMSDSTVHRLIKMADIIQPWTPGRYSTLEGADRYSKNRMQDDLEWCNKNGLLYMPVVFPGFSWFNKKRGEAKFNQIPRQKGAFYWRQFYNAFDLPVSSVYVAMFDEMDEGTCIFKTATSPPLGESPFLNYEGLPSDYYLWLTGKAASILRNERPNSKEMPQYPSM